MFSQGFRFVKYILVIESHMFQSKVREFGAIETNGIQVGCAGSTIKQNWAVTHLKLNLVLSSKEHY